MDSTSSSSTQQPGQSLARPLTARERSSKHLIGHRPIICEKLLVTCLQDFKDAAVSHSVLTVHVERDMHS